MPRALSVSQEDARIILGMVARGDKNQDIAAWFGINQGRIPETKQGKYGNPQPAPTAELPPKGPTGIKGRRLHGRVQQVILALENGEVGKTNALAMLKEAVSNFDQNEA